jgi:hypothetical protein
MNHIKGSETERRSSSELHDIKTCQVIHGIAYPSGVGHLKLWNISYKTGKWRRVENS